MEKRIFFDFLAYSLSGNRETPQFVNAIDWDEMYRIGSEQSLLGVLFCGISQLPKEAAPGRELLLKWYSAAEQIRRRNIVMNNATAEVYRLITHEGAAACVLKGQGNAVMYADPYSRTSGDIDVWMNCGRKAVRRIGRKLFREKDDIRFHHYEFVYNGGVDVELHVYPSIMNNPFYNRRMRKWFGSMFGMQSNNVAELPGGGCAAVPTPAFNVVYQLAHVYHHFFDEGIGLRQLVDYMHVLMAYGKEREHADCVNTLRRLGLYKFAGAVSWVLREMLHLDPRFLIVPPDARRGRVLLSEVMNGGNFGRYDVKYGGLPGKGMASKYFTKIRRNMNFVLLYPSEVIAEPLFRTWHFVWRQFHG